MKNIEFIDQIINLLKKFILLDDVEKVKKILFDFLINKEIRELGCFKPKNKFFKRLDETYSIFVISHEDLNAIKRSFTRI